MRRKALVPGTPNAKKHPKEPMRSLKKEISGLCVSREGGGVLGVLVVDQSGRVGPIIAGSVFGMSIVLFASAFRCTLRTFREEGWKGRPRRTPLESMPLIAQHALGQSNSVSSLYCARCETEMHYCR
jgi:hypothetical protein